MSSNIRVVSLVTPYPCNLAVDPNVTTGPYLRVCENALHRRSALVVRDKKMYFAMSAASRFEVVYFCKHPKEPKMLGRA